MRILLILCLLALPPATRPNLYVLAWQSALPVQAITPHVDGARLLATAITDDGRAGTIEAVGTRDCVTITGEGVTVTGIPVRFSRSWRDDCGPPRLLIIGDSISAGLAASSEQTTYRQQLAAALGADLTYIRATTIADVPGELPAADIIVLEVGLNDAIPDPPPIPAATWPLSYGLALDRLQATGALVVAATPFHGLYRAHARYQTVDRYAGYVRAAAQARGMAVADLWALADCVPACLSQASDYTPFPPLYHGDNFHPNDVGHARIAWTMLRAVRPFTVWVPWAR